MSKCEIKKKETPIRSKMSDEELTILLEKAKKTNPESFATPSGNYLKTRTSPPFPAYINDVIAKWL